ncbi:MAG: ribonuclease R family protein [Planctomycetota bacterium JB042]
MNQKKQSRKRKKSSSSTSRSSSKELRGIYSGHPRGFGFLVPSDASDADAADRFVPPGHEGDAIDGDTVLARPGENKTARVTRVVSRGRALLAGTYLGQGAFSPDAHRIPKTLDVDGDARKGDKVLVAPTKTGFRVRRVLGRSGAPDVEDEAVLAELEITPNVSKAVLAETEKLRAPGRADLRHRLDLRDTTTVVTIDPITSRDFDDAISLERRGREWELGVHIADVSHYVRPGTALDDDAYRRGTSVYLPNRVIPMLPEKLSNDLCSLREGVERLAMSVLMRFDAKGELLETKFAESVIRSDRRFSYERASRVMDRSARERGRVGALLLDMKKLAALLRRGRPSLDLPRSEVEFVYDGRGDVVDVHDIEADVAHGVIEEFMLAANREVARLMLSREMPALFRHHPRPDDLSGVWRTLKDLEITKSSRGRLDTAIHRAVEKGFGPTVTSAMLRCLPRAIYTTRDSSHYSLGFDAYTHFTSPIRRYADLTVHRQVRALLREEGGPIRMRPDDRLPDPVEDDEFEEEGAHVTARAIAADGAEKRIRRRRVLEFLMRLGGVPTDGQVTGVVEKGLMIELTEYGTYGFLPTDQLPNGPYRLDGASLKGGRNEYRLGKTLSVRIHRLDPASGQLDLALADG